jgi:hypothetical protein
MTAAPAHSVVVGGSTAQRLLMCPASVKTIAAVPPALVKDSSIYAAEGTALHSCVARMLCEDLQPHDFVDAVIGLDNGVDITITKQLAADCLVPVRKFFDSEIADVEAFWLEVRSEFPGIPGAFGTSDFAGRARERLVLADWKFGAGVAVAATYPDPDDSTLEIVNAQLLFYICGLRHAAPELFAADRPIDAYIVQPRNQDPDQRVTVARGITGAELDMFEVALRAAVDAALTADPPRNRGAHCRFAPCKAICPAHTGPLLDLARMQALQRPAAPAVPNHLERYGAALAAGLELAEIAEPLIRELRTQAHAFLADRHAVPGWKLVAKRAVRRWADSEAAQKTLLKSGFAAGDIFAEPELRSPAQIEKAAKLAGLPIPQDLEIIAASSGSTLAREIDDRPPAPDRDAAIDSFSRALATLKEKTNGQRQDYQH